VAVCGRYRSDQRILLVGEGDLSFGLALARAFAEKGAQNLTATTLDSEDFLKRQYDGGIRNAAELCFYGATVHHGVDATALVMHEAIHRDGPYDVVVFNFPHPGWLQERSPKGGVRFGHEQCPVMIERHRSLLRGFFESTLALAIRAGQPDLEVHVTTKTAPSGADWWGVTALAEECGLELLSESEFDGEPYTSIGYVHKYGVVKGARVGLDGVDGSFPLRNAVTRVFRPRAYTSSD
jgi:25S rRNA (uracil2634-N3)-methyltransferase